MHHNSRESIKIPKESLIRLKDFENKKIHLTFSGGRQLIGTLKKFDRAINLIMDNCQEILPPIPGQLETPKRDLGLVIVRGSLITTIASEDGYVQIENPFVDDNPKQQEQKQ